MLTFSAVAPLALIALATTLFQGFGKANLTQNASAVVESVRVIPPNNAWFTIPPPDREPLIRASNLSVADINSLIDSDSPDALGVAIFALYQQGRLEALLTLNGLLGDTRPSVPVGAFTSMRDQYGKVPRSVAEHLSVAYQDWLGMPATTKTFDKYYSNLDDPWSLPKPWIAKLAIATPTPGNDKPHDPAAVQAIKQEIFALDEPLRWAVLVELGAIHPHTLTRQELLRELDRLSPATRVAIEARSLELPYDPRFLNRSDDQMNRLLKMQQAVRDGSP